MMNDFDSHESPVLDALNMSVVVEESTSFDYLQDCVISLESKDSGVNLSLSSDSENDVDDELRLDESYSKDDFSIDLNSQLESDLLSEGNDKSEGLLSAEVDSDLETIDSHENASGNIKSEREKSEEPEVADDGSKVRACTQCPMVFKYKRHLDRHIEGHEKNNCTHCNAKFARKKHLDIHLYRIHNQRPTRNHVCDICAKSFTKRSLLNRHIVKHQETKPEKHEVQIKVEKKEISEPVESEISAEEIDNEDSLKEDFETPDESTSAVNSSNNDTYTCEECNKSFTKKSKYQRHLASPSHMQKYSESEAAKEIPKCAQCSKQFSSKRNLYQHIRRIHRGEKRFSCDVNGCSFNCSNKSDLDRHKQLHVEERNVVCEHCGKAFTTLGILKDHVLYVHNVERQFVCEECGKSFKRNSLLKRHKLSHQQTRPFVCAICGVAFKRSHHLTRHLETCHKIVLEKKKKVVKLMKNEEGDLVPVPEKVKRLPKPKAAPKAPRVAVSRGLFKRTYKDILDEDPVDEVEDTDAFTKDREEDPMLDSSRNSESPDFSIELPNLLSVDDNTPQILSLVGVNDDKNLSGVEANTSDSLASSDFANQFDRHCDDELVLSGYHDLGFQEEILNDEQNLYEDSSYSEIPLASVEETLLLLNSDSDRILPAIDSYLTQPIQSLFNL